VLSKHSLVTVNITSSSNSSSSSSMMILFYTIPYVIVVQFYSMLNTQYYYQQEHAVVSSNITCMTMNVLYLKLQKHISHQTSVDGHQNQNKAASLQH